MPDAARKWLEELIESLAELEHERWSSWMQYMFENWTEDNIVRWKLLMNTPYSELEEYSKESDRREVRKTITIIEPHLRRLLAECESMERRKERYRLMGIEETDLLIKEQNKNKQLEADGRALVALAASTKELREILELSWQAKYVTEAERAILEAWQALGAELQGEIDDG